MATYTASDRRDERLRDDARHDWAKTAACLNTDTGVFDEAFDALAAIESCSFCHGSGRISDRDERGRFTCECDDCHGTGWDIDDAEVALAHAEAEAMRSHADYMTRTRDAKIAQGATR